MKKIRGKVQKTVLLIVFTSLFLLSGCDSRAKESDLEAAYTQIEACEYEGALAALDIAEESGEDMAYILRARGVANMGLTNYEEAVEQFIAALGYSDWRIDDFDIDVNYYLADTYERMGKDSEAIDTYSAILGIREKDMLAHYRRGRVRLRQNDHDGALEDFERALKLEPDNYDLRIEIAGRLTESGYEDEGRSYLEQFLAEKEKKLSDFDKGRIYFYMEDYATAKTYFEEARDDDDQSTILFLGKTYEMLGDYNYATSTYQNYLSKHPEAALIHNQLGLSRLESGDYAGAKEAFQTARNLNNTGIDQTLSFNEIVACEYTGDFNQAKVLMEAYIKKYPDDEAAKREALFLSTR
ncbi:tetratricopeptide repeat protein [Lacrimispora saccharolytica]|uniref:tetratricopeptide repeat protein n=1 Tax=Lacrimispora saccharolytica TaxID=84030 RepID=UPI00265CAF88|nr:tetratricopeptide repeat protein [Lacrimispora saccharolytica]MBS7329362.1 tetratricopeptide repeat protein [Lachnospiraceae bacterium]MCF2655895.1 tetratricopeptide repeat protein [Lacrimispora saccharolytica]MDD7547922.1 tetratricopeptide repeat protein [Lachnospiraceae bacterium]